MQGLNRQSTDYSCGAASLSILLKSYFNDPIEEKSLLLDISLRLTNEQMAERISKGFSMLDLKEAAERIGYEAEGVILPPEAIPLLKGPVIVLLHRTSLNHFVVLKGAAEGRVFLADPAQGHLRMEMFEFLQQWNGETLILGREEFGLPSSYALSMPSVNAIAPERDVVRTLRYAPRR